MNKKKKPEIKEYTYFHIGNGGISFKVEPEYLQKDTEYEKTYPVFAITARHFGHQTNQIKLPMTPKQMKALGEWLVKESRNTEKWFESLKSEDYSPYTQMMFFDKNGNSKKKGKQDMAYTTSSGEVVQKAKKKS